MKRKPKIVLGKLDPKLARNPQAAPYLTEEFTEQLVAAAAIERQMRAPAKESE